MGGASGNTDINICGNKFRKKEYRKLQFRQVVRHILIYVIYRTLLTFIATTEKFIISLDCHCQSTVYQEVVIERVPNLQNNSPKKCSK